MGHSSRERVFVSNRLRQNVSNAFKVTIETILLREQWFPHVGVTLCYEGRETTASDRLLFYRVCTSKWRLRQNAFITSLPPDSQKTLGLWSIQRRGGKVNPACAWHFSVHLFAVIALLWRENAKTKFYFSFWTLIGSLGIINLFHSATEAKQHWKKMETSCVIVWTISVRDSADFRKLLLPRQWHWFGQQGLFFSKICQRNTTLVKFDSKSIYKI